MAAPIPRDPPVTSATLDIALLPLAGNQAAGGCMRLPFDLLSLPDPEPVRALAHPFHAHGHAHAASDAQGRKPLPCAAALHLEDNRVENARAQSPDRTADGNGADVDFDDFGVPAHVLVDGASLRGKGFVGLDEIQIVHAPAG